MGLLYIQFSALCFAYACRSSETTVPADTWDCQQWVQAEALHRSVTTKSGAAD